jgi:hypothetical protein
MARTCIRVPITNVFGGGDYTAQILIGSQKAPVNVILDTGSSSLAVRHGTYKPDHDSHLKPTAFAQDVQYGSAGWTGPVVMTTLSMGLPGNMVTVQNAPFAIADAIQQQNFGLADGVLGLAYDPLNSAYHLESVLQDKGIHPPVTFPWPFPVRNSRAALMQLQRLLKGAPQTEIPPYFSELEKAGVAPNRFAFYTLRSMPAVGAANAADDPLNQGFFVLGGGSEQSDLYHGSFVSVKVVADAWYNTNLKAIQVDGCKPVQVAPLAAEYQKTMISNSIIDSGTNSLALATDVYKAILHSLTSLNSDFQKLIIRASHAARTNQGIAASALNLGDWPPIRFFLEGEAGEDVKLTCAPKTYWQVNTPAAGQAVFQINGLGHNHSILGLPLMNNYYTVFDRSIEKTGVVRFAPIKHRA